jgi:hypothetical protein
MKLLGTPTSMLMLLPLIAIGDPALAHTTVRDQAREGVRADNALRIGHGCEALPVIAQSVVFPGDDAEVTSTGPAVSSLGEAIEQGSLAGLARLIQDRSIFYEQSEIQDANGNAVGFVGSSGRLEVGLRGRVPFEFTGPNFVPGSCASRLIVEVAIGDFCAVGRAALQAGNANLWIPDNGSALAAAGLANGLEGIGAPARLIVNRDRDANPLDGACGAGFDVFVTPSAEQIDRDLALPARWKGRPSGRPAR